MNKTDLSKESQGGPEESLLVSELFPYNTDPVRDHNIGKSDYSKHRIQPWDIWMEYHLNPWDADIVKRILRTKQEDNMTPTEARILDYEKIKHICDERIRQLKEGYIF